MDKESKEYEVGYGRPPKEYQFKPGTSGNYKGRPKKKSDFRSDLAEIIEKEVPVNINGQYVTMSTRKAALQVLIAKALKGENTALKILINLLISQPEEQEEIIEGLSADDSQLLQDYINRSINYGK